MILRQLSDSLKKSKKSILLIGPRQVGKSTLIKNLQPDIEINLAHEQTFLEFAQNPLELEQRIKDKKIIFIDEIQKLPRLTNTIQVLLDNNKQLKFYLTGSSARKLRRGKVNLLPGRILSFYLGCLTYRELSNDFELSTALSTGLLPGVYTEANAKLRKQMAFQYAATYLKEEIAAEGFIRNLEGFARFLYFCSAQAAKIVDLSKIAGNAYLNRATAGRFFDILEDTLIIKKCPAFAKSEKTRLIQHPKFYFFDTGVWNGLLKNFIVSEDRKGDLFESFIFNQITDILNISGDPYRLSFYRTENDCEVDFILERDSQIFAIEVKASANIGKHDLRGLKSFQKYHGKKAKCFILYLGNQKKSMEGNIEVYPWQEGLDEIIPSNPQ